MKTVNSKDNNSQINTSIIILLIVFLLSMFSGLYFLIFNGKLSNQPQDWASFGSYISGVLMPIFTAINIWVFVRLTQTISEKQKKFQIEESKRQDERQDERHKNESDHQKRLIITQMRQNELNKFFDIMNNAMILKSSVYKSDIINPLTVASVYLDYFISSKNQLFPILDNEPFNTKIKKLHKQIIEFAALCEKSFGINEPNEVTPPPFPDNINDKLKVFLDTKNEVISELEQFILEMI